MTWEIAESSMFRQRLRRYEKRYQAAAAQALVNAQTYFEAIRSGLHPMHVNAGFIHPEPGGAVAIDERGSGKKLHGTRLYLFAEIEARTLWFITIGDKHTQARTDIPEVRRFLAALQKREERDG